MKPTPAAAAAPTTTVTIQMEIKSTRIVEATAQCPYCDDKTKFEFVNDKLVSRVECAHLLPGRVQMPGNAVGLRYAETRT